MTQIVKDKADYVPPNCPRCGAVPLVDWKEIKFAGRPGAVEYMPGLLTCPNADDHLLEDHPIFPPD